MLLVEIHVLAVYYEKYTKRTVLKIKESGINVCHHFALNIATGVCIGNRSYWTLTLETANNYESITELHTPKITVTAHMKSSQTSLTVAW
jgi:hypothetical protein